MNFEVIPELAWEDGYMYFWLLAAGIMLFSFVAVLSSGLMRLPGQRLLQRLLGYGRRGKVRKVGKRRAHRQ